MLSVADAAARLGPADRLLVRFGELFLKGGNRGDFLRALTRQLERAVAPAGARVVSLHGRRLVRGGRLDEALAAAARTFGGTSVSPALEVPADLGAIAEAAVAFARAAAGGGARPTFKVETRRTDKRFPMRSMDVSREVGAAVVERVGLPVDVHRPDLRIAVEIGERGAFVCGGAAPGPGGLPVGTAGQVALLLSGGIDSPVAGWLAQKRGCELVGVYFHSFPFTGDRTRDKVIDLARVLARTQGPLDLFVVPFTEAQKQLRAAGPARLAVVLYRRMMMRAAGAIAAGEGALALVTGENVGQVASQTLANLAAIEDAAPLPVLRPLLTYDKTETVALARRIGSYDLSILPYEDCCSLFVPAHPATHARLDAVRRAESRLDVESIARDLADRAERVRCE